MADKKRTEPTEGQTNQAGKGNLDDEMLPNKGEPVEQDEAPGGDRYDTAGEHGDMAPESAAGLDKKQKQNR